MMLKIGKTIPGMLMNGFYWNESKWID